MPGIARLGPDALAVTRDEFAELLAGHTERIKTLIVDQTWLAGVGNAYSDEILHTAQALAVRGGRPARSPSRSTCSTTRCARCSPTPSSGRSARAPRQLKGEKRSGLRVHARTGLPCPVCGETVREVSFANRSFQYCPGCQTGGKPLADRRLSRLVR